MVNFRSASTHTEQIVDECTGLLGESLTTRGLPRIFATALNLPLPEVEAAFDGNSTLMRSGLIVLDLRACNGVRSLIDFITETFAQRMLVKHDKITEIIAAYVRPAKPATLLANDFTHIQGRLETFKTSLKHALDTDQHGVNILIYGEPGLGKTELAKVIATEIEVELIEISPTRLNGDPINPVRRMQSLRLAQAFFKTGNALLLFDECEEVLSTDSWIPSFDSEAGKAHKSWINDILESNPVPIIWVCNSVEDFDVAYFRRFTFCFEMPRFSNAQRQSLLTKVLGNAVQPQTVKAIAKCNVVSPALVKKAGDIARVVAKLQSNTSVDELLVQQINDQLTALGTGRIISIAAEKSSGKFDPELVNADYNLIELVKGIKATGQARLCIYGPPGTGKTAFGKWLADSIDKPHLLYAGSQLLAPIANQTEVNIAKAFALAKREGAVLQFDEVDSFLYERSEVRQSWEVSIVNEMLTQLESFDGVFIASTNRIDALDVASQRRFDLSIKFGYMKPEAAWELLMQTCEALKLPVDDGLKPRVVGLHNLAPGDFAQVARASAFIRLATAGDMLATLERASRLKRFDCQRQIGFV